MSNCCQRCQGMTTHWVPPCHIMQWLKVQALVCDHQAAPLLHQGGQLHSGCIVLDVLAELHQSTGVEDGFRRALPCTYLHTTV